ncbi:polyketide synthase, partial [Crossiella equi]|uniref:beta-ketoacyl [acyl carrier protein] synthase domain-containing protein n=1 Tax=Crossiella equi TaxID=130796 RepID=UPI001177CDF4
MIGAACRLPGGIDTPDRLWSFLVSGRTAVSDAPVDRWDPSRLAALQEAASRPLNFSGGFLSGGVGEFDPEFFGISPHEARSIDPQHRLLVEVAWEACEHAGLPISGLKNSNTGHFAGMCNNDHSTYLPWLPGGVDPYLMTGNQFGAGAGRVSHLLGLRGPAMAVDTSCSSGLVAAHLARQSLQLGECDLALASAVSLMLNPGVSAAFNELGVLSPTGSSKTFDRSADGYTRAEGCVVLVMKRLADAVTVAHRV